MVRKLQDIKRERIQGVKPCPAYSGIATAVRSFGGVTVIVLAADQESLNAVVRELNPEAKLDPALFMRSSIVADQYVQREDDEL